MLYRHGFFVYYYFFGLLWVYSIIIKSFREFFLSLKLNRSYLGMCSYCHPRESGDPEDFPTSPDFLDSRFRGNDTRKLRFPCWLRFSLL